MNKSFENSKLNLLNAELNINIDGCSYAQETKSIEDTEYAHHGTITFRGITRQTKAKYILTPDVVESASSTWRLMQKKWGMNDPSLIISVTGAATDFTMGEELCESFKSTIMKAARLPNSCIITGGKYGGVTRLVSDALETSGAEAASGISCLGIANWDKIMHTDQIMSNRPYVIGSWLTQKSLCLDYEHTHFLLVNNVGRKDAECLLRGALERYIMEECKAPGVRLILNGGVNVLNTICGLVSASNCYPIVIVQRSGRIADVFAYGLKNHRAVMDKTNAGKRHDELWWKLRDVLYDKYGPMYGGNDMDEWFEDCYEKLLYCLQKRDKLVLASHSNLDAVVMTALLAGIMGTETEAFEKMKLTLLWDRDDYARANIFTSTMKVKHEDLKYMMVICLSRTKHKYVKLLLDHGVNMHELLTVEILELLYGYQALEDGSLLKKEVKDSDFTSVDYIHISDANMKFRRSLGRNCIKRILKKYLSYGLADDVYIFSVLEDSSPVSKDAVLKDPFWELFLWALLCNLPQMAVFLWPFGKNQMAKALIAAEIWKNMAQLEDIEEETRATIREGCKSFKSLAYRLLERCYSSHAQKTSRLITTTLSNVSKTTCLDLAATTHSYEFVANSSIQNFLDDVWTGKLKTKKLSAKYYLKVLLNVFFPLCLSSLIDDTKQKEDNNASPDPPSKGFIAKSVNMTRRIALFYVHTPLVTYLFQVLSYLIFVCLYSYHITNEREFSKHSALLGQILVLWVIDHLLGELYHMYSYNFESYRKSFSRWFSDIYNKFDLINIVMFLVAWLFSCHEHTMSFSHNLHTLNCALWVLRFLTVMRIHGKLGLYLQMILEMLNDLTWFVLILFFVIVGYGVMTTSLLHPGNTDFEGYVRMFLRAWFHVYGEHLTGTDSKHPNPNDPHGNSDQYHYLLWFICGFYLLLTKILLLNLIIAAFNTTYARVHASADLISKYGKYLVVTEYSTRMLPTPRPFSLLHYMFLFIRWLYRQRCCCSQNVLSRHETKLRRRLSFVVVREREELCEFEYFCARQVYKDSGFGTESSNPVLHDGLRLVDGMNDDIAETLHEVKKVSRTLSVVTHCSLSNLDEQDEMTSSDE